MSVLWGQESDVRWGPKGLKAPSGSGSKHPGVRLLLRQRFVPGGRERPTVLLLPGAEKGSALPLLNPRTAGCGPGDDVFRCGLAGEVQLRRFCLGGRRKASLPKLRTRFKESPPREIKKCECGGASVRQRFCWGCIAAELNPEQSSIRPLARPSMSRKWPFFDSKFGPAHSLLGLPMRWNCV